jgi:branched-chain amino acid transport system permease protein
MIATSAPSSAAAPAVLPVITRSTPLSRAAGVLAIIVLIGFAAAPWWGSRADLRLFGEFATYLALASLWNLLAGYTGLVSVGQQAFVGLGGYLLFLFAQYLGVPPLLCIPIAGVIAGLAAIPVGALVFRLQGAYFAIGTWVVAEVFRLGFAQITLLGGGSGTSLTTDIVKSISESRDGREAIIYWVSLALGAGSVGLVYMLLRSRIGLALTAIRDGEVASASLGIDITRIKFLVYVLVAAVTAMVGALIFIQKLRISPDAAFSVNDWTAFVIFIVVIGGIGTIEGPIIGTIVYFVLRWYLADYGAIYYIILGALAIVIMLFAPQGLWGLAAKRFGVSLFPVGYQVRWRDGQD